MKMNRERWSLVTPYCMYCDCPPKSGRCFGNCPSFKKYRKGQGKKKYRYLIKSRLRKYLNEDT